MKVLLFLSTLFPLTTAFQIGQPAVHPKLKTFAEENLGRLVQVRLDIGKRASEDFMSLQGPIVKFLDGMAKSIPLPVANGPMPHLSSGNKHLEVVKEGFVIDMNGMKNIPFTEGCWEMTWREGDNDGRIVCAFDIPEPVSGFLFCDYGFRVDFPTCNDEKCSLTGFFSFRFNEMTSKFLLVVCF